MNWKVFLFYLFFPPQLAFAQLPASKAVFRHPAENFRPGVYWYFMDGNMSAASITKDLESMKKAGIGYLIFLEVNVGVPRGNVDFLSPSWFRLFGLAEKETRRLGIGVTLGIGPGWTGSGGPWVKGNESMRHLVASRDTVGAGDSARIVLPVPAPKTPFFGEDDLPTDFKKRWHDYYEDVAVLAYPLNTQRQPLTGYEEKALYYRAPYNSGIVRPYLPAPSDLTERSDSTISRASILDITDKMRPDGTLDWRPPSGRWIVLRFGSRNNGAITRPAPVPGLGFESDKFDTTALNDHLAAYIDPLLETAGKPDPAKPGGLKFLHMDSWEMGAQNWTGRFREAFTRRRGYDPLPWYPAYAGNIVGSVAETERFLWDLRQTTQELIVENHATHLKAYARRHGLSLSIEPYDMNPTADLELGSVADVPMAEFWSKGFGFNSAYSVIEATSVGHLLGSSLIPAEAFTANNEGWKQYPGSMKNQGDWAFASGINRLVYHTYQNQFLDDSLKPGATMAQFSVHWDRSQTWWPMVGSYHDYITRCQYMLQQGHAVADVLYLTPEGAPHVFVPPSSALRGDTLGDRRGFNFDGCPPGQLRRATVRDHRIVFPGGAAYGILVLPETPAMTPELLAQISRLVKAGATVVGNPPVRSPSLKDYPACDSQVNALDNQIWGSTRLPEVQTSRNYGQGVLVWGGSIGTDTDHLYPNYAVTAAILHDLPVDEDFSAGDSLRYTHRVTATQDIYFVGNATSRTLTTEAVFRSTRGAPERWNPVTGQSEVTTAFRVDHGRTTISLSFAPYESCFILFTKGDRHAPVKSAISGPRQQEITLDSPWTVAFDPRWGGPASVRFDSLTDWSTNDSEGIRYYSGIAAYQQTFDLPAGFSGSANGPIWLDLGNVKNLARVRLNGKDLGVLWTAPWRVDISRALLRKNNVLTIGVANLWINRLIGDEKKPDDGIKNAHWPDWLIHDLPRTSGRYTFTLTRQYSAYAPLVPSGLLGPVRIIRTTGQ